MLRRMRSIILWAVGGLLGLLALAIVAALLFYPPQYVYRVLTWLETDVNDYLQNFPDRALAPAPATFSFQEAPAGERVAQLFEQVFDVADLDTFLAETDTLAFLVIQDDTILYERYFNGAQRDSPVTSFSVAKSFVSALVGMAIDEGHIHSVDDPITNYLPELLERDERFEEITIRHLLLMASGLEYRAMRPLLFNGDDPLTSYYPDQRQAALEFTQIADPPGQYFSYNKYHPQLLGLILERATGVAVTEYMQQKLWDPLGMEFAASWSLDSEASGFEKMEAGINARALDFAKFGRLYLHEGNWEGRQVISAGWVAESTRVEPAHQRDAYYPDEMGQAILDDLGGYYQYFWYGYLRDGAPADIAAEGDRGQIIYISPHKELIIVRNSLNYGEGTNWTTWPRAFYQFAGEF